MHPPVDDDRGDVAHVVEQLAQLRGELWLCWRSRACDGRDFGERGEVRALIGGELKGSSSFWVGSVRRG